MPAASQATAADALAVALAEALRLHAHEPGGLLPALHHLQDALGHVPPAAVSPLAQAFNLSRAEVHGVLTYYHHFRTAPPGRHVVQVCRAEACQAMGADALLAHARQRLGCSEAHVPHGRGQMTPADASAAVPQAPLGGCSPDGRYTLEPVYCLGLCAQSPAAMVGQRVHARLTPQKFDRIIAALEQDA